jgi:hypothetical protein
MAAACSTSGPPAAPGLDGSPGEAFTACQIQGYVSELDGGSCPEGTCAVRAFDTNSGLLPCCTSVVSGPGMCLDAGDDVDDAPTDAATEAGSDAPADADAETGGDDQSSDETDGD